MHNEENVAYATGYLDELSGIPQTKKFETIKEQEEYNKGRKDAANKNPISF